MKEVLFVFFQTSNQANGGINSLIEIILNLKKVKPVVLTQRETAVTEKLRASGVEVVLWDMKAGGKLAKIRNVLHFTSFLSKLMRKRAIDVIHFNDMLSLMHATVLLRFWKSKRIIFNVRDVFEPERPYIGRWKLVNYCSDMIVLSHNMKESLLTRLPLKNPTYWHNHIHVSFSIVDFTRFYLPTNQERNQLIEDLDFDEDHKHLLYVATFNVKKNQIGFLQEFVPLMKGNNWKVHFIGDFNPDDNPYAAECENIVKGMDSNQLVFHGFKRNVEDFYKAADLTLVPTRREGLARCMIESLSSGTPVVSFDVASAVEILIDGKTGVVVEQGNYKYLHAVIIKLFSNDHILTELRSNALDLSRKKFSVQNVLDVYQKLYQ